MVVAGLNVRNRLDDPKVSVLGRVGDMNTVDQMVSLAVHADSTFRGIKLQATLERLDNPAFLDGSGLVGRGCPQLEIEPNVVGEFTYGKRKFATMPGPNTIQECLVGWIIKLWKIIEGDNEPPVFLGGERRELASLSKDGGNNRDLLDEAGRRKLSMESEVII